MLWSGDKQLHAQLRPYPLTLAFVDKHPMDNFQDTELLTEFVAESLQGAR